MQSVDRIRYRREEAWTSLTMFPPLPIDLQAELVEVMYDKSKRTYDEHLLPLQARYPHLVDKFRSCLESLHYCEARLSFFHPEDFSHELVKDEVATVLIPLGKFCIEEMAKTYDNILIKELSSLK